VLVKSLRRCAVPSCDVEPTVVFNLLQGFLPLLNDHPDLALCAEITVRFISFFLIKISHNSTCPYRFRHSAVNLSHVEQIGAVSGLATNGDVIAP